VGAAQQEARALVQVFQSHVLLENLRFYEGCVAPVLPASGGTPIPRSGAGGVGGIRHAERLAVPPTPPERLFVAL